LEGDAIPTEKVPMSRFWTALSRGLAILVLLTALPLAAAPAAGAASPSVVPLGDCAVKNSDGTWTLALGYTSTYATTQTFSHGNDNHVWPSAHQGDVPTSFSPGTQHAVWSITVTAADLAGSARWELDGTTLPLDAVVRAGCSNTVDMPAAGNGLGGVIVLAAAGLGAAAAVGLRRIRPDRGVAAISG
jgi:hypothetical protein